MKCPWCSAPIFIEVTELNDYTLGVELFHCDREGCLVPGRGHVHVASATDVVLGGGTVVDSADAAITSASALALDAHPEGHGFDDDEAPVPPQGTLGLGR